ncbi:MAG: MFS transporter [Nannocystaceae bacterium]
MGTLIFAGEAIFCLPFVLPRVFRPTMLDVFGLTNIELGLAFSTYGITAMIAYIVGGPLADRYSPRRLMTVAMFATAAGGVVLAGLPTGMHLNLLYAWWGVTSIFLFWAPLIRATREWSGDEQQGWAFGLLEGGRGLVAAGLGSLAVVVLALLLPVDTAPTLDERRAAFIELVWLYSGWTALAGILVWLFVPDSDPVERRSVFKGLRQVIRMPVVWLQTAIVICAYIGFKSSDDFSLYARDVFGYDDVEAAEVATMSLWIRPLVAVAAGALADRLSASRVTMVGFTVMGCGSLAIALGYSLPVVGLVLNVAALSVGIYGLRGVYFALFNEGNVPLAHTGCAVGIVSLFGYTPDVFMSPAIGFLIDGSPGALGHQYVFAVVAITSLIGFVCAWLFRQQARHR